MCRALLPQFSALKMEASYSSKIWSYRSKYMVSQTRKPLPSKNFNFTYSILNLNVGLLYSILRYKILKAVKFHIVVFSVMTPCSLVGGYKHLIGRYCLIFRTQVTSYLHTKNGRNIVVWDTCKFLGAMTTSAFHVLTCVSVLVAHFQCLIA